jgi:hypothetical protein
MKQSKNISEKLQHFIEVAEIINELIVEKNIFKYQEKTENDSALLCKIIYQ